MQSARVTLWACLCFLACSCGSRAPDPASPSTPMPRAPFSDFRGESPSKAHRIMVTDLPAPYATGSFGNGPSIVPRPAGVLPLAPAGFEVGLYVGGLDAPRVIRMAPNADVFVAESGAERIRVFRGMTAKGTPERAEVFAQGLKGPYGIAFYPSGSDPRWIYVGTNDAVLRFPYRTGDLHAAGAAERVATLPGGGAHWTRDLTFSVDGRTLFVAVGSASNIDDPDTSPGERERADILAMDPDGLHRRIHASGLRNPSGLAVDPADGRLWTVVNERDGLGDDLVPDYVTSVREGGFYGWPWWYLGAHQDPRHAGRHPELGSVPPSCPTSCCRPMTLRCSSRSTRHGSSPTNIAATYS